MVSLVYLSKKRPSMRSMYCGFKPHQCLRGHSSGLLWGWQSGLYSPFQLCLAGGERGGGEWGLKLGVEVKEGHRRNRALIDILSDKGNGEFGAQCSPSKGHMTPTCTSEDVNPKS